jgi:hypothetical protein
MTWTSTGSDNSSVSTELLYPDHLYNVGTKGLMVKFTDAVLNTASPAWTIACYKPDYAQGTNASVPVGTVDRVTPVRPVGPVLPLAPVAPLAPVLPTAPVAPVLPTAPVAPVEKDTLERTTSQVAPFHFQMRLPTVCVSLTDGEFGKSIAGIVTP